MQKAIFFDIDDTLYDQLIPFKKAFMKNFNFHDINILELFKHSRQLSDTIFELTESGQMSTQYMHIYRIKQALKFWGYDISDKEALLFQDDYSYYQQEIYLSDTLVQLLNHLYQSDIKIGIITNGPSHHQREKIKKLQLDKWISDKYIFISSELNTNKPDTKIFDIARKEVAHKLLPQNCYYVGDSYKNDVIGSKKAGWNAIWYNRRHQELSNDSIKPDYLVKNDEELYHTILKLFFDY